MADPTDDLMGDPRASAFMDQIARIRARRAREARDAMLAQNPDLTIEDWQSAADKYGSMPGERRGMATVSWTDPNGEARTLSDAGAVNYRSSAMAAELNRILRERNELKRREADDLKYGREKEAAALRFQNETALEKQRSDARIAEARVAAELNTASPESQARAAEAAAKLEAAKAEAAARAGELKRSSALRERFPGLSDEEIKLRLADEYTSPRAAANVAADMMPSVQAALEIVNGDRFGLNDDTKAKVKLAIQSGIAAGRKAGLSPEAAKQAAMDAFKPVIEAIQARLNSEYEEQTNPLARPLSFLPALMGFRSPRQSFTGE